MPTLLTVGPWLGSDVGFTLDRGASKSLRISYLVGGPWTTTGYNRLAEALTASGLPQTGSAPNAGSQLRLVGQNASFVNDDPEKVLVELQYVPVQEAGGTRLNEFVFSGAGSIQQVLTQRDIAFQPTSCSYTYPETDLDFPNQTEVQVADLTRQQPVLNISAVGLLARDYPLQEALFWTGRINSQQWGGVNPGFAMCTNVEYTAHDLSKSPPWWEFRFEFQFNLLRWTEDAIFRDPRTGRPPDGLVPGVGIRTYTLNPSRDFNDLFPNVQLVNLSE